VTVPSLAHGDGIEAREKSVRTKSDVTVQSCAHAAGGRTSTVSGENGARNVHGWV
jgi:hypothetical protein